MKLEEIGKLFDRFIDSNTGHALGVTKATVLFSAMIKVVEGAMKVNWFFDDADRGPECIGCGLPIAEFEQGIKHEPNCPVALIEEGLEDIEVIEL